MKSYSIISYFVTPIWLAYLTLGFLELREHNRIRDEKLEEILLLYESPLRNDFNDCGRSNEEYKISEFGMKDEIYLRDQVRLDEKTKLRSRSGGQKGQKKKDRSTRTKQQNEDEKDILRKSTMMYASRRLTHIIDFHADSHGIHINNRPEIEARYENYKDILLSDKNTELLEQAKELAINKKNPTSCILVVQNTLTEYSNSATFSLTLKLMTNRLPDSLSWALLTHTPTQDNTNKNILDSINPNMTVLLADTLYEFEYQCSFAHILSNKKVCYDFEVYNEDMVFGSCCAYGLGSFEMRINNHTIPTASGAIFGKIRSTSFCVNMDGNLIDEKEKSEHLVSLYPSRDCMGEKCVCDSNPTLALTVVASNNSTIYERTMENMMLLSGSEMFLDVLSPQYKAACWILYDDPYLSKQDENITSRELSNNEIVKQLIQRYIMALFFFATDGQDWENHHHFLSSQSECKWNNVNNFYEDESDLFISGCICDENENVISIAFYGNNIGGTIIKELPGLKSLGEIAIKQ